MRKDPSGINIPVFLSVTVVSLVLLAVLTFAAQALMYYLLDMETQAKIVAPPSIELVKVRAQQHQMLNQYRWVDQEKALAAIPIDRAIELYLERERPTSHSAE